MDAAELVDAWRVYPRLLLGGYGYICWHLTMWYEALKVPTTEQSAFAGAIVGLAVPLSGLYMGIGGKDWSKSEAHAE